MTTDTDKLDWVADVAAVFFVATLGVGGARGAKGLSLCADWIDGSGLVDAGCLLFFCFAIETDRTKSVVLRTAFGHTDHTVAGGKDRRHSKAKRLIKMNQTRCCG